MQSSIRTSDDIHLRILATSDLHATIRSFDYCTESPLPGRGLEAAAALIGQLRRKAANTLLVDNGDFLQGNPLADLFAGPRSTVHPVIASMNALGYDAAALGNHEFNYGLSALRHALAGARFPALCANVAMIGGDSAVARPRIILDRRVVRQSGAPVRLRVGVFGLLPPQIMTWDRQHLDGRIAVTDIVEAARTSIAALRGEGADLVIALCHSGVGPADAPPGSENMAAQVAALPGLNALVAGHSHDVFPLAPDQRGEGVPSVLPGCFGSHVGMIDLRLQQGLDGRWTSSGTAVALRVADHVGTPALRLSPEARVVRRAAAAAHRETCLAVRRPVGQTEVPLTTHFAALPGNAALALIAGAQADHVARALHDTAHGRLPLLSAAAPFKFGGRGGPAHYTNVRPGPLAVRHVADLYIHPNRIAAVAVTGAELKAWLERSAEFFLRIIPGQPDQPLVSPDRHASEFDVIHGVTYRIDLSAPVGHRITGLFHLGHPIDAADRFVVATNSYRAQGGGGFPGAEPANIVLDHAAMVQDVLRDHIARLGTVRAAPDRPFAFAPLPGSSVLVETARAARADLPARPDMVLEDLGDSAAGLARFRFHL